KTVKLAGLRDWSRDKQKQRFGMIDEYDGSRGSELLLQARTGSLLTEMRLAKQKGGGGQYLMCKEGDEDEEHIILRCRALEPHRGPNLKEQAQRSGRLVGE